MCTQLKKNEAWLKALINSVVIIFKQYPFLIGVLLVVLYLSFAIYCTVTFGRSTRGFAFLLGLPLAVSGLYLANKRTSALIFQSNTDSERLVTETFAKSIELLGHKKAAVRQGSIYALGKIAKTHKGDHPVIISSLCAFIRNGSKGIEESGDVNQAVKARLPIDIETAIEVFKDRNIKYDKEVSGNEFSYDLSNIIIKNADFSRANLASFNLQDSKFDECAFNKVDLTNASLIGATFMNTDFAEAILKDADFRTFNPETPTDLSRAVNLTQFQINEAKGNKSTMLPTGINLPESWNG